ncbi:hypothetical protein GIB67_011902 [Kingdonia uniflora]|uniref:Uncharacterized protein n=1 Tax=Kingdonia uniflora TaxID=39325 RepID=A0A7J7LZU4_9MAGN|nr:hypothetical protein GIB67_011902 [Kingdonia uniflora]
MLASGTTANGEVAQGQRMRVEPLRGSRKKVAEVRFILVDNLKEVEDRAKLVILQGMEDTSQMLGIDEQESGLKKAKGELEKNLARAKTDAVKEVKKLKAGYAVVISQLQVETKANLDETAEELDRLGRHLMLKGYSQEEVDAIMADTYAQEEKEEIGLHGVVDGLDGVFPRTVLNNQGDDVELSEDGGELETPKALLYVQAELQVELDPSRARGDYVLMCNKEFAGQFNKMKEANENSEDRFIKATSD